MRQQHFRQEDCLWLLVRVCERFGLPFSADDALRVAGRWDDEVTGGQLEGALASLGVAASPARLPARRGFLAADLPFVALLRSEEADTATAEILEEVIPVLVVSADRESVSVSAAGNGAPIVLDRASFQALARREVLTLTNAGLHAKPGGFRSAAQRLAANDPRFVSQPVSAHDWSRSVGDLTVAGSGLLLGA